MRALVLFLLSIGGKETAILVPVVEAAFTAYDQYLSLGHKPEDAAKKAVADVKGEAAWMKNASRSNAG